MLLTSALVAGSLALQASAFLIPLEVSRAAEEAQGQIESIWSQATQTVELDCLNCPFFGPESASESWDEDDENQLVLDFSIDNQQSLRINDRLVFSVVEQTAVPGPLSASQVRITDLLKTEPVRLGWALEVQPPITSDADPGKELYALRFTVLDLKGVPVEVDSIKVDLLKYTAPNSEPILAIVKIKPVSFSSTPGATSCQNSSSWSLCRLRAIIAARINAMLEIAKAHAGTAKTWAKGGCKGKKGPSGEHKGFFGGHRGPFGGHGPHGDGEGHHRGHHGHHRHHGQHGPYGRHHPGFRMAHMIRQTIRFFIVPALLGVIGGLVASAVGMLVGQFIVFLWLRFHRGVQRGTVQVIEVAVEEDETDVLIFEKEELPPQYTDLVAVVVDDEK